MAPVSCARLRLALLRFAPREVGAGKACAGELGVVEVSVLELGPGEVGAGEVAALEIGAGQVAAGARLGAAGEEVVARVGPRHIGRHERRCQRGREQRGERECIGILLKIMELRLIDRAQTPATTIA